jgi:hypothetical protein
MSIAKPATLENIELRIKLVTPTLRIEAVVPPKLQKLTLDMIEPIYQIVRGYVTEDSGFVVTAVRTPNNNSVQCKIHIGQEDETIWPINLWRPLCVAPQT